VQAYGGVEVKLHTLLALALRGQLYALAYLPPGKKAFGIHWLGDWVGPRAGLDMLAKREVSAPAKN